MLVEFDENGGGLPEKYTIYLCMGEKRPETLTEVKAAALGKLAWDQVTLQLQVPITKSGVIRWAAMSDGFFVRIMPVTTPILAMAGSPADINLEKK